MVPREGFQGWRRALIGLVGVAFALGSVSSQSATAGSAAKKAPTRSAAKKLLDALAEKGPVQDLRDSNFTRYSEAGRSGRPYHLVLLFTASGDAYKCVSCKSAAEAMGKVALAYKQQYDIRTADEPIVFATADFANLPQTFGAHDLRTIPHAYLIPKGQNLPRGQEKADMEVTGSLTKGNLKIPKDFVEEILRGTGVQIVLLPDSSGLFPMALLVGATLGLIAHFFVEVPGRLVATLRWRGIWMTASMACYMTGVGGMIYCIIRNPHPYGFDQQTGNVKIFSNGGRDQFWYEGAVVGFLYVIMTAAILGIYRAAGWKRAPCAVREVVVLTCLTVLCYVANIYFTLYTSKTQWYSLDTMLGAHVTGLHKGPLKRSHGLLKRLVRVSHLWLNEYTTMEAFAEKLKTFLWDFLVRKAKSSIGL